MMTCLLRATLVTTLLLVLAACGDDGGTGDDDDDLMLGDDDDDDVGTTFTEVYDRILSERRCRECHDGTTTDELLRDFYVGGGELDFSDRDTAYALLVNQAADGNDCEGFGTLVVPFDPDASLLLTKVQFGQRCGDRMPLLNPDGILLPDEVALIESWIVNGALDN